MTINVLDYLDRAVTCCPKKTAFADRECALSYEEFARQARCLGSRIAHEAGERTGRPVFVFIDRSVASVVCFFGALYSGNFYVPIDKQLPAERIRRMLDVVTPAAVLFPNGADMGILTDFDGPKIAYGEAIDVAADKSVLAKIRSRHIDQNPVYAMFTSGTTGAPKGVLIGHRSLMNLTEQFMDTFAFPEDSVFGNQAPFDFDVSTKDIYMTIRSMGSMVIIPKEYMIFPLKLVQFLNEYRVNTLIWATSVLRIVHNMNTFETIVPEYLRYVMFSGEVMSNKVLNYWRSYLPDASFVNLYGPTEITCNCSYFKVDRLFADSDALPIGVPFANTEILLLDGEALVHNPGEQGEICVRGTPLALGYYGNAEKTASAFVQNPLNLHYPDTIYRTGDLGCYNERGELMYLGRKDHQIKHLGHRIELGEIEAAVNALPFVDMGCCIYDNVREKIVLFYQSKAKCDGDIASGLLVTLPKFMLPKKMLHYQGLPMNKNGKIDRVFLRKEYELAEGNG